MKKIYKYAIIAFLGLTGKGFAQVNVSSEPNKTIVTDHPFLDASGYTNDVPNNQNKGLYFPSTNLTTWEFKTNMLDGITFPTAYNGMVVYNTGTGNTVSDVTKGGVVVPVKPGFYYFYNPNNAGGTSISTGYWKAFDADIAANNGLTLAGNTIQLGGDLNRPTTIATTISGTTYPLLITGLPIGDSDDQVMVVDNGQLKMVEQSTVGIEPWNKRLTTDKATENTDAIYQQGNVAIGTQNGIGTFNIDATKNNPATGTPTATNVLDDVIVTPAGRIGIGYNPSDVSLLGRQLDDKVTYQANEDLDFNYSLATTSKAQAIVHRNIISNGTIGARTARPNGTSIAAFEGHTTTSSSNYALGSLSTEQRAGIVLRTGKENNVGGEIWFGVSGASAGDGGKTLDATAGVKYRAVMDQRGNWAFGSDPNFDAFYRKPSERIDLILGGMRIGALGYGPLAAWKVQEIAERPNYISTNPNDRVVVADENGVLKVKEASALVPTITTNNGITKNTTTSEIELGGALNRPTVVTTTATNTLAIAGLQPSTSSTDRLVVADANGVLKTTNAAAPKEFYAPSIVLPTTSTNLQPGVTYDMATETFTVNLHDIYSNQFGMAGDVAGATRTAIKSPTATTLTTHAANALEYFVTYFDNTVFDPTTITLSDAGVMTYKVLPSSTVTEKTYMNIVFKVK